MAKWKKVVVSGSQAALSSLTLSTQLAVTEGGTGISDLTGQEGKTLAVNGSANGFTFADASAPSGTVSSSAQTIANLPSGTVSGSVQVLGGTGILSGSILDKLPSGTVSSSAQTIANLPSGTVSSSAQVTDSTFTGNSQTITSFSSSAAGRITTLEDASASAPAGTISSSAEGSAQGTIQLNGVNVNIKDMQTDDSPTFIDLTLTGNATLGSGTEDKVTVSGDLIVKGTASFENTENLLVKDRFITLNSGSNTPTDDGGIIVETSTANGGEGPAFAYNGGDSRWGVASKVQSDATSYTADAFMSAVVVGSDDTLPTGTYAAKGNIFIGNSEDEVWIYGS